MEAHLERLKLILQDLGIPASIQCLNDRVAVQKGVYLAQRIGGVKLGYRFHWYLRGPYSPPLTRDYYDLATESEDIDVNRRLPRETSQRLKALAKHLSPPTDLAQDGLTHSDWLELLASLDYCLRVRLETPDAAKETIKREKEWLAPYVEQGLIALQNAERDLQGL